MPVLKLVLGDVVRTRKPHPCGSDSWEIVRLGADIGLRCVGCGRHVLMPRAKLERRIKAFVTRGAGAGLPDGGTAPVQESSPPET